MKTKPYTIKGSLVKDHIHKRSYNLTSRIDAETLCNTLTQYETEIKTLHKTIQTENNLDKLKQQVIALQMDIKNCQSDLDKIKELLK